MKTKMLLQVSQNNSTNIQHIDQIIYKQFEKFGK